MSPARLLALVAVLAVSMSAEVLPAKGKGKGLGKKGKGFGKGKFLLGKGGGKGLGKTLGKGLGRKMQYPSKADLSRSSLAPITASSTLLLAKHLNEVNCSAGPAAMGKDSWSCSARNLTWRCSLREIPESGPIPKAKEGGLPCPAEQKPSLCQFRTNLLSTRLLHQQQKILNHSQAQKGGDGASNLHTCARSSISLPPGHQFTREAGLVASKLKKCSTDAKPFQCAWKAAHYNGTVVSQDAPLTVLQYIRGIRSLRGDEQARILSALDKTASHPGVWEIHLLVARIAPFFKMVRMLRYTLPRRVVRVSEIGRQPVAADFVKYASQTLTGRTVLVAHEGLYPEGPIWSKPLAGSMLLSRQAKQEEDCKLCAVKSCDATEAIPKKALCGAKNNKGDFVAWVHRFEAPVKDERAYALLNVPMHGAGALSLLGHVFEKYLKIEMVNRCDSYRLYHLYCLPQGIESNLKLKARLATQNPFATSKWGDHADVQAVLVAYDTNVTTWERSREIITRNWPAAN